LVNKIHTLKAIQIKITVNFDIIDITQLLYLYYCEEFSASRALFAT